MRECEKKIKKNLQKATKHVISSTWLLFSILEIQHNNIDHIVLRTKFDAKETMFELLYARKCKNWLKEP